MKDGILILDQSVKILACNRNAKIILNEGDGVMRCGQKLRFEDKQAFSILLKNMYSLKPSSFCDQWYANRISIGPPYCLKLYYLNDMEGADNSALHRAVLLIS